MRVQERGMSGCFAIKRKAILLVTDFHETLRALQELQWQCVYCSFACRPRCRVTIGRLQRIAGQQMLDIGQQ